MSLVPTIKMSSQGQIVIPEDIRNKLALKPGSQFMVLGDKDVVILNAISSLSFDEFDVLISKARKQAKAAGLKKSDISAAIAQVRGSK